MCRSACFHPTYSSKRFWAGREKLEVEQVKVLGLSLCRGCVVLLYQHTHTHTHDCLLSELPFFISLSEPQSSSCEKPPHWGGKAHLPATDSGDKPVELTSERPCAEFRLPPRDQVQSGSGFTMVTLVWFWRNPLTTQTSVEVGVTDVSSQKWLFFKLIFFK